MSAISRNGLPGWPIAASLAFHALLIIILLLLPKTPPPELPPEETVSVEIVTPPSPPPPPAVQELAAPPKNPAPPEPPALAPAEPPPMVRATNLYAAKLLADPRNAQAREGLTQLAEPDRMEQLCNAEAMEQIQRWRQDFAPDRLIAYAFADTRLDGTALVASGAAFRSKRQWYTIKFKCGLTPDLKNVASFEFQVGDAIPKVEWAAHNLSPVY